MKKSNILIGILTAAVGILMLINPSWCGKVIVLLLGVAAIVNGIFNLVTVRKLIDDTSFQMTIMLRGIISIIIGLLAVSLPEAVGNTMWTVMMYILGAYLLASACMESYAVAKLRSAGIDRRQYIMEIVITLIASVIMFVCPAANFWNVLCRIMGSLLLLASATYIIYLWKTRDIVLDHVVIEDDTNSDEK